MPIQKLSHSGEVLDHDLNIRVDERNVSPSGFSIPEVIRCTETLVYTVRHDLRSERLRDLDSVICRCIVHDNPLDITSVAEISCPVLLDCIRTVVSDSDQRPHGFLL